MEKAKIGGIRTPKPLNRLSQNLAWVITSAIWPSKPKFKPIAPVGASRRMGEISLSRGFLIFFCDHDFCSRPETKQENRFLRGLLHRMSIPGYWFPREIKLQKIPISPIFTPKTPPKWAWIGIFRLNAQNIKTCILSKLLNRFKPNFAQWQRPPKYTSWVV